MNERIKHLAERCQIETYGVNGELLALAFDEEKFAELIVKECIDKIIFNGMNREDYSARLEAAEDVRKHFG